MKIQLSAVAILLPILVSAQEKDPKKAVGLFNETQKSIKSLSGPDASCVTCQVAMSPESLIDGQADVCDDLFAASCTDKNGKLKYDARSKNLPDELQKSIKEARDKTAQEMGFKDFDDALIQQFKKEGLELRVPLDSDAYKSLLGNHSLSVQEKGLKLYSSVDQCDKESKVLQNIDASTLTTIEQRREAAKKFDDFNTKFDEIKINLLAKDIPSFINNQISSKCSNLKFSPNNYKIEDNRKASEVCGNIVQIRNQAVSLYRLEGSPEYEKQTEKFVRENLPPDLKYSSSNSSSSNSSSPELSEYDQLDQKISSGKTDAVNYCSNFSYIAENAGDKIFENFVGDMNKSKATVDAVIDSFYGDTKKVLAEKFFKEARTDIQSFVKQFVQDPVKQQEIISGYDKLSLRWMEKPPATAYKKSKNGKLILDAEKDAATSQAGMDSATQAFSDASLSFFTELNADYLPSLTMGKFKQAERVNILPAIISFIDKNPYAFLSVIAHEAGHKIGPAVSVLNGYDLRAQYKDLTECYKDSKSIKMKYNQMEETFADYMSSEVLAQEISKLPTEQRKQALMSSMETFCIFDVVDADTKTSVSCSEDHPENSLRVAGIFGANPDLRDALGCVGESPKFKSCGLKIPTAPAKGAVK